MSTIRTDNIQSTDNSVNIPVAELARTSDVDERVIYVGSVAELEALSLPAGVNVRLTEDGRAGDGVIKSGTHASDPQKGVFIDLANGNYWERQYGQAVSIEPQVKPTWFGLSPSNTPAQNSSALNAAAAFSNNLYVPNGTYEHAGFSIGSAGGGVTLQGEDQIMTRLRYIGAATAIQSQASYTNIKSISLYGDDSGVNYWTTGSVMIKPDGVLNMEYVNCRYWDKIWDWNGGFYHKLNVCQFLFFNVFSDNLNGNNLTFDACRLSGFNSGPEVVGGTGPLSFINGAIERWSGRAFRQNAGSSCSFTISNNYIENYPGPADRGINEIVSSFIATVARSGVIFEQNNIQSHGIRRGVMAVYSGTGPKPWIQAYGNKWTLSSGANNDLEYAYLYSGASNVEIFDPLAIYTETGHTQSYPFIFNQGSSDYIRGFNAMTGDAISPAFISATLLNGWTNDAGADNYPLEYTKTADGDVVVRGLIDGGSSTSVVVATLPAGYRPLGFHWQATADNTGTVAVCRVLPSGDLRVESPAAPNNVIINIRFRAEA